MSSRRCHFSNRATRPRFNPPLSGVCAPLCQRLPLLTSVKYPVINTPTSGACFQNKTGYDSYFFFFFFISFFVVAMTGDPTNKYCLIQLIYHDTYGAAQKFLKHINGPHILRPNHKTTLRCDKNAD